MFDVRVIGEGLKGSMDWDDGMCISYIVKVQMQRILELGHDTKIRLWKA